MFYYDAPSLTYDSGALYDDVTAPPPTKRKNMAKVKFTLNGVPDADAIQTCNNIKTALTGNASFATPTPTLTVFGTAITTAQTKLTAADNAAQSSKQATADKDAAMDALKALATQLAGYVDMTAAGDESKILSAGLDVRSTKTPQSVPNQVANLSVTAGDNDGSLDAHWDPLGNAKSYEVQTSADPFTSTSFVTRDTVTKSSTTIDGLTSGSRMWVRVRAINSAGKGAWSDPAVKVVP